MDRAAHWNRVYETKSAEQVSWYQRSPERSLALIQKLLKPSQRLIDIGAGASVLVDSLLVAGYERPIVLDIATTGLDLTKKRLGSRAELVDWIVADIVQSPSLPNVDLWHDRAVLHFLTERDAQVAYADLAARTVRAGGCAVIATFAPDGPEKCSGLPVQRHDGASVSQLLGSAFELVEEQSERHVTPSGGEQKFAWSILRRRALL